MWKNYCAADCPWLIGETVSTVVLPSGERLRTHHENGGSKFPAGAGEAWARAQLFITQDAAVALLVNSYDEPAKKPDLEGIIRKPYFDAVKGRA